MGETDSQPPKKSRGKRWIRSLALVLLIGLVAAELFARFYLGLGDPVLYFADPEIEYLQQPSKRYSRLGHRISYNQWSMRADEFPKTKSSPDELRIMVMGDSIVNGGSRLDQSEIAAEIIKPSLRARLGRPVMVGNIAANSWGPVNVLAYVRRHGLCDADVVVIVLNYADAADVPTFARLGPQTPTRSPVLALEEVARLWIPVYWNRIFGAAEQVGQAPLPQADVDMALEALRELIELARTTGASIVVIQALTAHELAGEPEAGTTILADFVRGIGIEPLTTADGFAAHGAGPKSLFLDDMHPNAEGQRVLAAVMENAVLEALGQRH